MHAPYRLLYHLRTDTEHHSRKEESQEGRVGHESFTVMALIHRTALEALTSKKDVAIQVATPTTVSEKGGVQ